VRRRGGWAIALASCVAASSARAQEALLPSSGWGSGASLTAWHLSTPLPQSGGGLVDIAEFAVPFRIRTVWGKFGVDLSGAGVAGGAHFTASKAPGSSSGGNSSGGNSSSGNSSNSNNSNSNGGDGDRVVSIYGPTDLKLRITGPIWGDRLLVTAGLNIPTGKVGLSADETTALQAVSAPALRMPFGSFGSGGGATLGVIRAFEGDDWAVAIGASLEQRTEYSAIALALASGKSETKIAPGTAAHVTFGVDRSIGESRLSALVVGDIFSKDKVKLTGTGTTDLTNGYQLGPQVTATTSLDFGAAGWRESAMSVAVRARSQFSDSSGAKVSGSSGTYLEAAIGGVRGGNSGAGLIIGADARWHSGLKFTDALVGSAVTAVGVTIGVERAGESTLTRFFLHPQYGSFDTGTAKTTGIGVTVGFTVSARREAK
jgi:hypothetical protein